MPLYCLKLERVNIINGGVISLCFIVNPCFTGDKGAF